MKVSDAPKIDMVDLSTQYNSIADELRNAFEEILTSTAFINGPYVRNFQADLESYLDARHVVPCGNGTDALQIALMALGLQPGDEVIVPCFTFVASIEVIGLLGFTPVIVDVDKTSFNLDASQLEEALSSRTRAIMPVHLFGQCADMEAILSFARKHDLFVIEDNAQSIGARYTFANGRTRMSGTMGDLGCLSFYPSKNLGAYGDAGAVISQSDEYGNIARSITNHGMAAERYYHQRLGVNSRLDSFQAAVLQIKLRHLDGYIAARQQAADYYDSALKGIEEIRLPGRSASSTHVFHQYTIQVPPQDRDKLKAFLAEKGVPTMIYYPVPSQDQEAFRDIIRTPVSLERTNVLCRTVLSLPMHSELTEEQLSYISNSLKDYFGL